MKTPRNFQIRPAHVEDVPIILELIRDLAAYERAPDEVTATKEQLVDVLFGTRPVADRRPPSSSSGAAGTPNLAPGDRKHWCELVSIRGYIGSR